MDFDGFHGFQGSEVFRPVASNGSLWRPLAALGGLLAAFGGFWRPLATFSSPLKKVYGALEAWILDAWRLGGLGGLGAGCLG